MTSTQTAEFIATDDVYQALLLALAALEHHGYWTSHATALVDDPNNYECRCCTVIPDGQHDRYVLATGGAGTTCTASLIVDRGGLALSWRGDGDLIVAELRAQGLDASWDGDPDKCVLVDVTDAQRRHVADWYDAEIDRYAEQDDECDDDEWGSDLDEDEDGDR